jgi:hypothetical protein
VYFMSQFTIQTSKLSKREGSPSMLLILKDFKSYLRSVVVLFRLLSGHWRHDDSILSF